MPLGPMGGLEPAACVAGDPPKGAHQRARGRPLWLHPGLTEASADSACSEFTKIVIMKKIFKRGKKMRGFLFGGWRGLQNKLLFECNCLMTLEILFSRDKEVCEQPASVGQMEMLEACNTDGPGLS